ncbi:MAG: hypothetical protein IPK82_34065 [Polyangiaceae bacterium]|nr:hypothetical protein [Polyangiaceae bacterium]
MKPQMVWKKLILGLFPAALTVTSCLQVIDLDDPLTLVEDFCTSNGDCSDNNACTDDVCTDGLCSSSPGPDGLVPDGIQGNCAIFECENGVPTQVYEPTDVDDGNDCTDDECSPTLGAGHAVKTGAQCVFQGGFGKCDSNGVCVAACGYLDANGNEVGCDPSDNVCAPSYCDKGQGICVEEILDGIPVPGSPAPNDCGGSYCVDGAAENQFAPPKTSCVGATNAEKFCDGAGTCVECVDAVDCNPNGYPVGFCFTPKCENNKCVIDAQPDGTVLPGNQQNPKDCQQLVCQGNVPVSVADNGDLPDDSNACTGDACINGTPTHAPTPAGSPCGINNDLFCNGAGQCSNCVQASECGTNTDCLFWSCTNNDCIVTYIPDGTPVPSGSQTPADCLVTVCNGAGMTKNVSQDSDTPDDANACTQNTCSGGVKTFPPVPAGSPCLNNRICDNMGNCLGGTCNGSNDCPNMGPCVDGVCCNATCTTACTACSNALTGGPNGQCGVALVGTGAGTDCPAPKVCDGTSGATACKSPNGISCSLASECLSTFCVDGFCCGTACNGVCQVCNSNPGTCTPIPAGTDPENECPGTVNCSGASTCGSLLPLGTACTLGSECQSNNCVDGVCCDTACPGTCKACNLAGSVGTCSNVPSNSDPAMECAGGDCNGAGACEVANGATCTLATQCISGFCTDGVCCNSTCTGTCKACSLANTMGTCTNVPAGQDPDDECVSPPTKNCAGNGMCEP